MILFNEEGGDKDPPLGKIIFLLTAGAVIIWIICYAVSAE